MIRRSVAFDIFQAFTERKSCMVSVYWNIFHACKLLCFWSESLSDTGSTSRSVTAVTLPKRPPLKLSLHKFRGTLFCLCSVVGYIYRLVGPIFHVGGILNPEVVQIFLILVEICCWNAACQECNSNFWECNSLLVSQDKECNSQCLKTWFKQYPLEIGQKC